MALSYEQSYRARKREETLLAAFSDPRCGNCKHWMTQDCPHEYDENNKRIYFTDSKTGREKKVIKSNGDIACAKFHVKQQYLDHIQKNIDDIDARLVEIKLMNSDKL